jgi:hypothetical protein
VEECVISSLESDALDDRDFFVAISLFVFWFMDSDFAVSWT